MAIVAVPFAAGRRVSHGGAKKGKKKENTVSTLCAAQSTVRPPVFQAPLCHLYYLPTLCLGFLFGEAKRDMYGCGAGGGEDVWAVDNHVRNSLFGASAEGASRRQARREARPPYSSAQHPAPRLRKQAAAPGVVKQCLPANVLLVGAVHLQRRLR